MAGSSVQKTDSWRWREIDRSRRDRGESEGEAEVRIRGLFSDAPAGYQRRKSTKMVG
jgi:hypothetical protein